MFLIMVWLSYINDVIDLWFDCKFFDKLDMLQWPFTCIIFFVYDLTNKASIKQLNDQSAMVELASFISHCGLVAESEQYIALHLISTWSASFCFVYSYDAASFFFLLLLRKSIDTFGRFISNENQARAFFLANNCVVDVVIHFYCKLHGVTCFFFTVWIIFSRRAKFSDMWAVWFNILCGQPDKIVFHFVCKLIPEKNVSSTASKLHLSINHIHGK